MVETNLNKLNSQEEKSKGNIITNDYLGDQEPTTKEEIESYIEYLKQEECITMDQIRDNEKYPDNPCRQDLLNKQRVSLKTLKNRRKEMEEKLKNIEQ